MLGEYYSPEVVDGGQKLGNYSAYRYQLEGTPHGAIHAMMGGDMGPSTSPNGMFSAFCFELSISLPQCRRVGEYSRERLV